MSKRPLQLALVLGLAAGLAAWVAPRLEHSQPSSTCAPAGLPPADAPVAVCGTVSGGEGAAEGALTVACLDGDRHPINGIRVDTHGRFQGWLPAAPCRLTAFRTDGAITDPGTGMWIHPSEGDAVEVDLWAPNLPAAGMGVQVEDDIGGVYVRDVFPGTPASRAGLQRGDRIVAIDGAPTEDMRSWDFIERSVGSPGTQVVLDIRTLLGERRVMSMRRQVLPRR